MKIHNQPAALPSIALREPAKTYMCYKSRGI
jgi:hypothetical protein